MTPEQHAGHGLWVVFYDPEPPCGCCPGGGWFFSAEPDGRYTVGPYPTSEDALAGMREEREEMLRDSCAIMLGLKLADVQSTPLRELAALVQAQSPWLAQCVADAIAHKGETVLERKEPGA